MNSRILTEIAELKQQNAELKAMMLQLIRSVPAVPQKSEPQFKSDYLARKDAAKAEFQSKLGRAA